MYECDLVYAVGGHGSCDMSLKERSFKENGARVILGIVHLLGQVAVIYALIDATNGTVTVILNLNAFVTKILWQFLRVCSWR